MMSMRPGLAIGAALQLKLASAFAIQPEVLFSCKGFKLKEEFYDDYSGESIDITEKISFRYLEIPVLFQVLIPAGDAVIPQLYAGPAVAFKTGFAGKEEAGDEEELTDKEADEMSELLKTVDFGITMGAGLGIKAGPGRLVLDIRFTLGLTDIQDIPDLEKDIMEEMGVSIEKERNMAHSFLFGYMFEF